MYQKCEGKLVEGKFLKHIKKKTSVSEKCEGKLIEGKVEGKVLRVIFTMSRLECDMERRPRRSLSICAEGAKTKQTPSNIRTHRLIITKLILSNYQLF